MAATEAGIGAAGDGAGTTRGRDGRNDRRYRRGCRGHVRCRRRWTLGRNRRSDWRHRNGRKLARALSKRRRRQVVAERVELIGERAELRGGPELDRTERLRLELRREIRIELERPRARRAARGLGRSLRSTESQGAEGKRREPKHCNSSGHG